MDKSARTGNPGKGTPNECKMPSLYKELLSIGVEKHQAAFSSGTWLTGTPLTYLAPW